MVSAKANGGGAAETAPPRFTSGDNLNVDDVPYLQPAPRQPWEPYGWACRFQAARWRSEGLADYNPGSANPSDVWANDIAYHYSPGPGSWRKGQLHPLSGQNSSLLRKRHGPPSRKGTAALLPARSRRFSIVARLGGNVPAWLVLTFQATGNGHFVRSPYSPGKGPDRDMNFKKL